MTTNRTARLKAVVGTAIISERESDTRAMIDYLRRWYQYGGGSDDDIFVTFGVSSRAFFSDLLALLDNWEGSALSARERTSMQKVCRARLWLTDPGATPPPRSI